MTIIDNSLGGPLSEGVSISKSNVLINQVPTITDAGVGEIASNISDPDHSLNYTCGTSIANFSVSYGAQTNLIVKFVTVPNNFQMTVSYIAAGEHLTLTHGTQAGYKRNWLNRHTVQRTSTNLQVGPVSTTQRSKAMKGSLRLPNEYAAFAEGAWQSFIDFSYGEPFFLKEVSSKPESTYICYDPKFDDATHGSTTTLNVLTLSFTLFNGL